MGDLLEGVLKTLRHLITLREQALFLGSENWNRYDFMALLSVLYY